MKKIIRGREGPYTVKKESIQQEEVKIQNVHVPNNRVAKYVEQKLRPLKGKRDKSIVCLRTSTFLSFSLHERTTRQKIKKHLEEFTASPNSNI